MNFVDLPSLICQMDTMTPACFPGGSSELLHGEVLCKPSRAPPVEVLVSEAAALSPPCSPTFEGLLEPRAAHKHQLEALGFCPSRRTLFENSTFFFDHLIPSTLLGAWCRGNHALGLWLVRGMAVVESQPPTSPSWPHSLGLNSGLSLS